MCLLCDTRPGETHSFRCTVSETEPGELVSVTEGTAFSSMPKNSLFIRVKLVVFPLVSSNPYPEAPLNFKFLYLNIFKFREELTSVVNFSNTTKNSRVSQHLFIKGSKAILALAGLASFKS